MTTNLARRNPRRRNLSRNKKIGIGLVTVGALGGITALVVALRRRKSADAIDDVGDGGQGSGSPSNQLALHRAQRRLCINPDALTLEQRVLLQEQVFIPLIASSADPNSPTTPDAVAARALADLCRAPVRAKVAELVSQMAWQAWQSYTGFAG